MKAMKKKTNKNESSSLSKLLKGGRASTVQKNE